MLFLFLKTSHGSNTSRNVLNLRWFCKMLSFSIYSDHLISPSLPKISYTKIPPNIFLFTKIQPNQAQPAEHLLLEHKLKGEQMSPKVTQASENQSQQLMLTWIFQPVDRVGNGGESSTATPLMIQEGVSLFPSALLLSSVFHI